MTHRLFAGLKPGMKFSTNGDGGRCSYLVKRFVQLLPYKKGKGYAAKTVKQSSFVEVVDEKFSSKHAFIPEAGNYIGMHGSVWYLRLE